MTSPVHTGEFDDLDAALDALSPLSNGSGDLYTHDDAENDDEDIDSFVLEENETASESIETSLYPSVQLSRLDEKNTNNFGFTEQNIPIGMQRARSSSPIKKNSILGRSSSLTRDAISFSPSSLRYVSPVVERNYVSPTPLISLSTSPIHQSRQISPLSRIVSRHSPSPARSHKDFSSPMTTNDVTSVNDSTTMNEYSTPHTEINDALENHHQSYSELEVLHSNISTTPLNDVDDVQPVLEKTPTMNDTLPQKNNIVDDSLMINHHSSVSTPTNLNNEFDDNQEHIELNAIQTTPHEAQTGDFSSYFDDSPEIELSSFEHEHNNVDTTSVNNNFENENELIQQNHSEPLHSTSSVYHSNDANEYNVQNTQEYYEPSAYDYNANDAVSFTQYTSNSEPYFTAPEEMWHETNIPVEHSNTYEDSFIQQPIEQENNDAQNIDTTSFDAYFITPETAQYQVSHTSDYENTVTTTNNVFSDDTNPTSFIGSDSQTNIYDPSNSYHQTNSSAADAFESYFGDTATVTSLLNNASTHSSQIYNSSSSFEPHHQASTETSSYYPSSPPIPSEKKFAMDTYAEPYLHTSPLEPYSNEMYEITHETVFNESDDFADIDLDTGRRPNQIHCVQNNVQNNAESFQQNLFSIVCFGFGGMMVVCMPRVHTSRRLSNDVNAPPKTHLKPGIIRCISLRRLLHQTSLMQMLTEFPGPLSTKTKNEVFHAFVQQRSTDANDDHLFWRIINSLAESKGDFTASVKKKFVAALTGEGSEESWLDAQHDATQDYSGNSIILNSIEKLLLCGNIDAAIDVALKHGFTHHALIIAGGNTHKNSRYQNVISFIVNNELPDGVALRTAYLALSGQLHTAFTQTNTHTNAIVENWRRNLAMLVALNCNKDAVLLGDVLPLPFSHVCYLLADDIDNNFSHRFDVIGVRKNEGFISCAAMQLTECYEYAINHTLPHLQLFKIMYASLLIDVGIVDHALDYVQTVIENIQRIDGRNRFEYSTVFLERVTTLQYRLKRLTGGGGRAQDSGLVGKLMNTFSRMLIGKESPKNYDSKVTNFVPNTLSSASSQQKNVISPSSISTNSASKMKNYTVTNESTQPENNVSDIIPQDGDDKGGTLVGTLRGMFGLSSNGVARANQGANDDDFPRDDVEFVYDKTLQQWRPKGPIQQNVLSPPDVPLESTAAPPPPPPRRSIQGVSRGTTFSPGNSVSSRYVLSEAQYSSSSSDPRPQIAARGLMMKPSSRRGFMRRAPRGVSRRIRRVSAPRVYQ